MGSSTPNPNATPNPNLNPNPNSREAVAAHAGRALSPASVLRVVKEPQQRTVHMWIRSYVHMCMRSYVHMCIRSEGRQRATAADCAYVLTHVHT